MAYFVVAYPKVAQDDLKWIQEYRKANDRRYFSLVEPHFTLVFGISDISTNELVGEVRRQSTGVKQFDFEIRAATINRDASGMYYHEFLVPDQGYSEIIKLHDRLYSDVLAQHLRLDIDFIPHIGIGNADTPEEAKRRVDEINRRGVCIKGKIDTLDIIEYVDASVRTIEKIGLM